MSAREVHVTLSADIAQALDGVRKARLVVRRMRSQFGIRRQCDVFTVYHGPHGWERLNPATERPFRRGRVAFLCPGITHAANLAAQRPTPAPTEESHS